MFGKSDEWTAAEATEKWIECGFYFPLYFLLRSLKKLPTETHLINKIVQKKTIY